MLINQEIDFFVDTFKHTHPDLNPEDGIVLQTAENMGEKRVIKSHLPFSFYKPELLDTCKVKFYLFMQQI